MPFSLIYFVLFNDSLFVLKTFSLNSLCSLFKATWSNLQVGRHFWEQEVGLTSMAVTTLHQGIVIWRNLLDWKWTTVLSKILTVMESNLWIQLTTSCLAFLRILSPNLSQMVSLNVSLLLVKKRFRRIHPDFTKIQVIAVWSLTFFDKFNPGLTLYCHKYSMFSHECTIAEWRKCIIFSQLTSNRVSLLF